MFADIDPASFCLSPVTIGASVTDPSIGLSTFTRSGISIMFWPSVSGGTASASNFEGARAKPTGRPFAALQSGHSFFRDVPLATYEQHDVAGKVEWFSFACPATELLKWLYRNQAVERQYASGNTPTAEVANPTRRDSEKRTAIRTADR